MFEDAWKGKFTMCRPPLMEFLDDVVRIELKRYLQTTNGPIAKDSDIDEESIDIYSSGLPLPMPE